jgi:Outer membrane protein beta-barrel domain
VLESTSAARCPATAHHRIKPCTVMYEELLSPVSVVLESGLFWRKEITMKVVCAVLLLGLSVTASAQSPDFMGLSMIASAQPPDAQQTPAQPPPQQQSAQSQTKAPPAPQQSQRPATFYRWEISGGYAHISGNEGMDGFNVGGSVFLAPNFSLGFNYDGVYDTTVLGSFALTNVGLITTMSHMQDFLAGGRFYFPGVIKIHCGLANALPVLRPFAQAQFGESNLWTQVSEVNAGSVSTSETTFSWLIGGGGEFRIADHWAARVSTDLLRTHFVHEGQSRIRIILGVVGRF